MASHKNGIGMILLFLTIYVTRIITGITGPQIECFKKMDHYCNCELLPDPYNDAQVYMDVNERNVPDILMDRWQRLMPLDCIEAEILKWTKNDQFTDFMLDYRNIIRPLVYNFQRYELPVNYCRFLLELEGQPLRDCVKRLHAECGRNYSAVSEFALDIGYYNTPEWIQEEVERGLTCYPRHYLLAISQVTIINPNYRGDPILKPYDYCLREFPDDLEVYTVQTSEGPIGSTDSPSGSTQSSFRQDSINKYKYD